MISFEAPTELAGTIASLPANLWQELLPADNQYVVSIHLLTEDEMQQLNRTTRSIDKPTDVLSFPLFENIAALPEHDAPLGDLFICLPCVDEAHLGQRECVIHGTLHLLGFDHETEPEKWDDARRALKE